MTHFLCGLAEILQPRILEASCMTCILIQVVVTIMSFEVM